MCAVGPFGEIFIFTTVSSEMHQTIACLLSISTTIWYIY